MTDCTATIIATALNAAWNVAGSGYAKPVDGFGASGFTTTIYNDRRNLIERTDIARPALYASLRQTFRIWYSHPVDAALTYCISLINALTVASTVVLTPSSTWFDGTNYNCLLEIVTIQ
jgi:hypothetical protein